MQNQPKKLTFHIESTRVDEHGSLARGKLAEIPLDTDMAGRADAFNPAELLLAAVTACLIKGIERVTPLLKFSLRGVTVKIDGVRQDVPPRLESITYEILVDTDILADERHRQRKFSRIYRIITAILLLAACGTNQGAAGSGSASEYGYLNLSGSMKNREAWVDGVQMGIDPEADNHRVRRCNSLGFVTESVGLNRSA